MSPPGGLSPEDWALKQGEFGPQAAEERYPARVDPGRRARQSLDERLLLRALAGAPAGGWVLDLGCGTGRFFPCLARSGFRVLGLDRSGDMLRAARARYAWAGAPAQADALRLPLADRSVGAALVARFLHLPPPEVRGELYAELARVSRGPVVFLVHCATPTPKQLWRRVRGRARPGRLTPASLAAELEGSPLRLDAALPKARWLSSTWAFRCLPRG